MNHRSDKMFAIGHLVIPIVLFTLFQRDHQKIQLLLVFLSFFWSLYLIWHAFIVKNLYLYLKKNTYWFLMLVDVILNNLTYVLPEWEINAHPTWLLLFLVPLYALELGIFPSFCLSMFGLGNIYILTLVQGGNFFSMDTMLVAFGILMSLLFIGRNSDRLQKMAYYDALTQLPNRLMMKDQLTASLRDASKNGFRLSILFLDLDQFKYVNDTMGHAAGDVLLQTVALRIKKVLPKNAMLARMGGDEFTILIPKMDTSDVAARTSEAIIETLKSSFPLNHNEVYITASIGISVYPEDGRDADTLMKNADTAMYRAKDEGRNNYQFYTPSVNQEGIERLKMETMLRHAIERDEFVIYYQPRINTKTRELVCVEALVRWVHPELGMIHPKDFISLAEDTGLIVEIGELVLRKACMQRKKWTDLGLPLFRISVNLSPRQFRQLDLPEVITKVFKETKMDPSLLELEITESAAMQDVNLSILMLRVLKDMGMTIAIDDFGTGYSSLSYLKKFPIDVIKIDQSFIRGIQNRDSDDAAIVRAIIVLAHTLKLDVTAEGVETWDQAYFLEEQNCDEIQGFLFGKPMTPKTLQDWFKLEHTDAAVGGY
ncbi:EAL domain-containing protein [Paenibacillus psychroresistens]|uniref:EAL domain-containing protein n=1 Tax=Paenibacillus psychroresistens TaxID=1778678 RepID=A0A6B8RK35_9BACL|nr:EAL domain-containing protein [Paenibacillus psychroresistens]QGQ95718.1 EAL domain-containing protein [Paenibacillus psychroresistens]